jgi:hypothetical protein
MESREQTPAPPHEPASGEPPARDQAPVATDRQEAITGDPGFGEQQPRQPAADPDAVHATSAPPPGVQSGTPLPQDRAAASSGHTEPSGEHVGHTEPPGEEDDGEDGEDGGTE